MHDVPRLTICLNLSIFCNFILEPSPCYNGTDATSLSRLPYQLPPQLKQTIAAPILMFSSSHMTLGPYGTALWIDNHAEVFCPKLLEGLPCLLLCILFRMEADGLGWLWMKRRRIGSSDGQMIIDDYA